MALYDTRWRFRWRHIKLLIGLIVYVLYLGFLSVHCYVRRAIQTENLAILVDLAKIQCTRVDQPINMDNETCCVSSKFLLFYCLSAK